ncbi:MAG TPA: aldehyde dehydrogenase family protein [Burkholderiaceae bacterium]|nr:aldehyde dehydrogenase family protein [Burkholderiaceae bacterium]
MQSPSFLANPAKRLLIGGEWLPSQSGEEFETLNPATAKPIARLARGRKADVDRAVSAARKAFEGEWSRWTPYDRQRLFVRILDLVERRFDDLALLETMDMGAPLTRTRSLKAWLTQALMYYATQTVNTAGATLPNSLAGSFTTFTVKAPVGVVGGIIPWNGPLISQWWVLGPVLATGCTVVMKPAEDASLTVLAIAELLLEAGLPPGVVNVVTGYGAEAGAALAEHEGVDRVAFTGSTETGRKIVAASAGNMKRLQLELGGKSPDIVFADANLDIAVPGAAMAAFSNSGQICFAGTRLFVQRKIHDEFVDKLTAFSKTLKVGNGMDPAVQLGPLISGKQLDKVMNYVRIGSEQGATLASGGQRLGGELAEGYFVAPTVFADVHNDMTIAREEIFGPVVSVIPFDGVDDAVRLANDTVYGLGSAVWTENLGTALRMTQDIKAGTVWINCYGMLDPSIGFAGTKMSGYGNKGGPQHVDGFLVQKVVYIRRS